MYLLLNKINGKVYVGKTERTLMRRWKEHLAAAQHGATAPLYLAMRKYGVGAFVCTLLSSHASTKEDLNQQEIYFIAKYRAYPPEAGFGYNLSLGGEGCKGSKRSPETYAKISRLKMGNRPPNLQQLWALTRGKPKSSDHRRKIGLAQEGERNHRFGKPSPNKGKTPSAETLALLSQKAQACAKSADYKRKHHDGLVTWAEERTRQAITRYAQHPLHCQYCHQAFTPTVLGRPKLSNASKRRYCGNKCAARARVEQRNPKLEERKKAAA